jgi:hypothetical protein
MSFAYRCMSCRGRNTLRQPIDHYLRPPKCRHCSWVEKPGAKRFYVDKLRQFRTDYCSCEGYHYRHRAGSKFCTSNPQYEFNVRTARYQEDPEEVRFDIAFDSQAALVLESEGCPF